MLKIVTVQHFESLTGPKMNKVRENVLKKEKIEQKSEESQKKRRNNSRKVSDNFLFINLISIKMLLGQIKSSRNILVIFELCWQGVYVFILFYKDWTNRQRILHLKSRFYLKCSQTRVLRLTTKALSASNAHVGISCFHFQ